MNSETRPLSAVYTLLGPAAKRRFPPDSDGKGSGQRMCRALIDEFGICIAAEQCFFDSEDVAASCPDVISGVRIGLGRAAFGEAVQELEKALEVWERGDVDQTDR